LAEVAPAVGLSAAGIVKRFGSRQGVLLALSRRWIAAIPQNPTGDLEPVAELREWVVNRFAPPHGDAQGLSQLIDDLLDDELRRLLAEGWGREQAYIASLLNDGDLPGVNDSDTCAAILFDALNGAALRATAEGRADRVLETLDNLLEQWT
jgi:AcrR family transcriptional regulator